MTRRDTITAIVLAPIAASLLWATVGAALFAMWASVACGLVALAALVVGRRHPVAVVLLLVVATPLVLGQLSLPALAHELDAISCRARSAMGENVSTCTAVDAEGTGPLLSAREQLAIRWFNAQMALGGWLVGYEEVAWETWKLDALSNSARRAEVQGQTFRERRRYCREGAAADGPRLRAESDFAMDAAATRRVASKLAQRTRDGQERWEPLPLDGGYARNPWHVVLALWVPGAKLHAERHGESLSMWWKGDLHYPTYRLGSVRLPRPLGASYDLTLDEAFFCAAQLDGVFVPFEMTWAWQMPRDDARLEQLVDQPRVIERLAR